MLMGGIRWTIAGALLARLRAGARPAAPGVALWPSLALQGLLMLGFGNGFVNWAEQYVPSGLAAVTLATSPFWMSGVEALRADGERLSRGALCGPRPRVHRDPRAGVARPAPRQRRRPEVRARRDRACRWRALGGRLDRRTRSAIRTAAR